MAILTKVQSVAAGVDPAFANAAGGGDSFKNTGAEKVIVQNTDGSAHTVTFDSPGTCNFGAAANAAHDVNAVNVPAGAFRMFGPFPPPQFNDGNDLVQISYSAATGMKVAVVS